MFEEVWNGWHEKWSFYLVTSLQTTICSPTSKHSSEIVDSYIILTMYLEPVCPLFLALAPPKQGLFQSKRTSFGFQVYLYIYIQYILIWSSVIPFFFCLAIFQWRDDNLWFRAARSKPEAARKPGNLEGVLSWLQMFSKKKSQRANKKTDCSIPKTNNQWVQWPFFFSNYHDWHEYLPISPFFFSNILTQPSRVTFKQTFGDSIIQ